MCNQYMIVEYRGRKHQVKCGTPDHHGAIGWCCGCAVWPTWDGGDGHDCDGSNCCVKGDE